MVDHRLLKPAEVAGLLGISRSRVYVLCQQGIIPKITIGHSIRVPSGALSALIEHWEAEAREAAGLTQPRIAPNQLSRDGSATR